MVKTHLISVENLAYSSLFHAVFVAFSKIFSHFSFTPIPFKGLYNQFISSLVYVTQ